MHAEPEILEIELRKIFAVNRKRVEVVLFNIPTVLASFLVFSPDKTDCEQDKRCDDRCDDVDGDIAAKTLEHANTVAAVCDRRNQIIPALLERHYRI
jgi:hypothetical protein